jgi:hypothetical protein
MIRIYIHCVTNVHRCGYGFVHRCGGPTDRSKTASSPYYSLTLIVWLLSVFKLSKTLQQSSRSQTAMTMPCIAKAVQLITAQSYPALMLALLALACPALSSPMLARCRSLCSLCQHGPDDVAMF